jgi:hypothetical protein
MATYSVNCFAPGSVDINGTATADFRFLFPSGTTIQLNSSGLTQMQVTDDDPNMSGDRLRNERASDRVEQTTTITGQLEQVYVENSYTVQDQAGNQYTLYVFDVGNSPAPIDALSRATHYIGYDARNPPPFDQPLTIVGSSDAFDLPYQNLICFEAGTLIDTPHGARPAGSLQAGDRVLTRDHGARELLWTGQRTVTETELLFRRHWAPVLVRAGAFGPGAPTRDTLFSPQHRLLVAGAEVELMFGEPEALASARSLVDGLSVLWPRRLAPVTYVHLLLDRHEVLSANGMAAESLLLGPAALRSLAAGEMDETSGLFPDAAFPPGLAAVPARPILRHFEGRALALSRRRRCAA